MKSKILIGLPCYNEEENIVPLIEKYLIMKAGFKVPIEILLVNDGSNDATGEIIKEYSNKYEFIKYIDHIRNKGLSEGMRTIFNYALKNLGEVDYLVVMDSDNTHDPYIIPDLFEKAENKKLDIVVASRFVKGGKEEGLSLFRKLLSRGAGLYCKTLFNVNGLKDYSCGYRIYKVEFLKKLNDYYNGDIISMNGFECMVEIVAKSKKLNVKIGEYPMILKYNFKIGKSKMKIWKTVFGYFKLGLKLRLGL